MLECLKKIGPGAIVASATIGAGETVLAVRAGAWGGYSLLWLILLATITKSLLTLYMLGRYSAVSGQSVIEKLVVMGNSYTRDSRSPASFCGYCSSLRQDNESSTVFFGGSIVVRVVSYDFCKPGYRSGHDTAVRNFGKIAINSLSSLVGWNSYGYNFGWS